MGQDRLEKSTFILTTILFIILISLLIFVSVRQNKNSASIEDEISDIEELSSYEYAVKNGFTGTESEWLLSLKGSDSKEVISILKTKESYGYDTYTIIFSDESTCEFNIPQGVDGIDGLKGKTGEIGAKGNDGLDVSLYINDDGYFVINNKFIG